MDDFINVAEQSDGMRVKLWRGERMCLIGMDVPEPEADFVGFSIEVSHRGEQRFVPLRNRLHFAYTQPPENAVTGYRNYDSTEAPFQKFRWIHFPHDPKDIHIALRNNTCAQTAPYAEVLPWNWTFSWMLQPTMGFST
jgi:hypothetical protein